MAEASSECGISNCLRESASSSVCRGAAVEGPLAQCWAVRWQARLGRQHGQYESLCTLQVYTTFLQLYASANAGMYTPHELMGLIGLCLRSCQESLHARRARAARPDSSR